MVSSRASTVKPGQLPWPTTAYAWAVVAILCFANVVSFIDRSVITLMVGPIKADLGLTDTHMGLLMGFAFALFYALMAVPIGVAADRWKRTRIISIGVIFWTIATACCGLAKNFGQLFLARMSVGIGEATLSPSTMSLIGDYFPRDRMAKPIGAFAAAGYAGFGIAILIGGYVVQAVQQSGPINVPVFGLLQPWQFAFVCVAVPGVLVWALMFLVREPARRGLTTGVEASAQEGLRGLFTPDRGRAYLAILIGFPVLAVLGYGTASWVPEFFRRIHGWQPADIALGYGLVFLICGTAGPFAGGWFTDWLAQRGYRDANLRAAIMAVLALVPFQLAFPLVDNAGLALALLVPTTFLGAVPFGVSTSALITITPNRRRALVAAIYLFIGNLVGLGLGPLSVALITDHVFADEMAIHYSLVVTATVVIPIGLVALLLGLRPFKRAMEEEVRLEQQAEALT
ncbi:MAG: spinster family MFS transporter [Alphaproteobacteria bacterium]